MSMSLVKTTHGNLGVVSGIQANMVVVGDSIYWALCQARLFVFFLYIYTTQHQALPTISPALPSMLHIWEQDQTPKGVK